MGIKKESDGTYTVNYCARHPITRQPVSKIRRAITSEREAKRIHAEIIVQVNDRLRRVIMPTWSVLLERYLTKIDQENELMKGTIYKRDKVLKKHTLATWADKLVDQITTQDIRDLLDQRFCNNAESHRKFFIKGVRGVMQYALEMGLINRDPTPKIKFKVNEKIKTVLNEEQILTLLRRAQELEWEWYPHYATALYTGLRSGELFALKWDSVNLEKRQILVNCAWSSKDGFKSTKSGHDRVVEIPKPLVPVLAELKLKSTDSDFVLPRMWKWEQGEQARTLKLFLKSIGLPEVRFHDLRASWATLLLSKGVAPSKVMSMGGWSDMKTMMIYMRKAGIDIKGATSCLDDMQIHGLTPLAKVVQLPFS
jgi:integrase